MAQQETNGLFIPTSQVWDIQELYDKKGMSEDVRELFIRLYEELNKIALAINMKDSGMYTTTEFVSGQTFFSNPSYSSATSETAVQRSVYRKVINFGALPVRIAPATSANISIAHGIPGINSGIQFTRIYGCSSNKTNTTYIPIPYSWPNDPKENIAVFASTANVTIVTGDTNTWANYNDTVVILEYLKT